MMKNRALLLCVMLAPNLFIAGQAHPCTGDQLVHTYSIVARDTATGEMAVGVESHWFSVGSIVSWGRSGVGVVATQSFVDPAYGPDGLRLMSEGMGAEEALKVLLDADQGREFRQVAFLDAGGRISAFTGNKCIPYASHVTGNNYSVQGNMMLNDGVIPAMSTAFRENDDLPLAERVVLAMAAAQKAGGDIRGRQSAALIVVGPDRVEEAWMDKKVDLRVEDHSDPVAELGRLLRVHRAYEHMNRGDVAVEQGNMEMALEEYGTAEAMCPDNLEMKFWKAVTLANNDRLDEALPIFRAVFSRDAHWKQLAGRLPGSGLLTVTGEELQKILGL